MMTMFRGIDRWLLPYLTQFGRRRSRKPGEPTHLLLCIADHYEPKNAGAGPEVASRRVGRWIDEYPRLFERFRDADGHPPRHTFFYPAEEYEPAYLDALSGLCRRGFAEVEVHLHHDGDTSEHLRSTLISFKTKLADRHGLLARDARTGAVKYGFIHGNWALDNSRPDGRWCGVNDELSVLRETGCYADFTLPSAPGPTQTRTINQVYYAVDDPSRPKSHDTGFTVGRGPASAEALMLIQGPLLLDWQRRKWGLIPWVENGCLQPSQPPGPERIAPWLRARVQVPSRPDWFFVKLHAHGCEEPSTDVLLGEPMVRLHEALARRSAEDDAFQFHYVSAREMYNLARAAEDGRGGSVADARDYALTWGGAGPTVRKPAQFEILRG